MRPERARAPELRGLEPVDWQERPLGELIECFDQLRVPVKESERRPGRFPYYGASGVVGTIDDYIFHGEHLLIAEDGENLRTRKTPIAFRANGKFWVNNHAHIVRGNEHADTRYLEYALQVADIDAYLTGAVMPKLTQGNMRLIPVAVPPLAEQRAIASILGALDDKIELNRRMNETLEGLARALFKSWFVDFDPVRAKAAGRQPVGMDAETARLFPDRFVESAMGPVPKGWRVGAVGDLFEITMGQSPPGESYNESADGLPFFQGRTDFGFRFPTRRVYCTAPTRLARAGDVLVSVRAPVGDVNVALEACAIGRGVASIRSAAGHRSFAVHAMKSLRPKFQVFESGGTVFGSIGRSEFERMALLDGGARLVERFESIARPLDDRVESNERQSRTLASLRDSLLPKLLSGVLRVRDAERAVETAT